MAQPQDPNRVDPLRDSTKYEKLSDLNSGSFGFVHLYRNTLTGESVAIKFIERSQVVVGMGMFFCLLV